MAEFKIDGRMKVKTLKENFKNEFGGILHVKFGKKLADDDATLATIRSNDSAIGGELVCRASRTVGKFEQELWDTFGIKVNVFSPDDWVAVLDGVTLSKIKDIPKNATKADMENMIAYKRGDASLSDNKVTCGQYEISIEESGSVVVTRDGEIEPNTKEALRKIAEECNFKFDEKWNTRQLGKKLVVFFNNDISTNRTNDNVANKFMHKYRIELSTKYAYDIQIAPINEDIYEYETMCLDEAEECIDEYGDYLTDWAVSDEWDDQFELKVFDENDNVVYESECFDDFGITIPNEMLDEVENPTVEMKNFVKKLEEIYLEEINQISPNKYVVAANQMKWQNFTAIFEADEFDPKKLLFVVSGITSGTIGDWVTDLGHVYYGNSKLDFEEADGNVDSYGITYSVVECVSPGEWEIIKPEIEC